MRKALLIEDTVEYQLLVRAALNGKFAVTVTANDQEAMAALTTQTFDLILIDVGLPGKDGMALCQDLRADPRLQSTPILFVTGRRDPKDLVQGFESGADDYIYKPFHPEELVARIEARFKKARGQKIQPDHFWKSDLRFAIGTQRVTHTSGGTDRELDLTPNEFRILYHLAMNEGRALSRAEILREVWGENLHVVERTVDKHICSLRRKMGPVAHYIASVPGTGYQFRVSAGTLAVASGDS
ncbi:MAG: response regulator transcription factor [Bdellovibrionota bacterium]